QRIAAALVAGAMVAAAGAWGAAHERTAHKIRLCRANAATAAAIWPLESGAADTISPAPPSAAWAGVQRSVVADAAGVFGRVNRTLSIYLGQWAQQATDACEAANVRGELSREELALRTTCLDERLSEARAVSDLLVRADARVVTHAMEAALGLPDLD